VGSGAIALNGTNAFVQLPATVANQQEITVAAWVYWNGGNAWQRIFDFGNGQSQYMFLTPSSGTGNVRFGIKNEGAEQTLDAPALAINMWTHVAVTLGASGVQLFVNGQKVAESATIAIRPLDFKPVLNYLGRSQYPDALFSGRLDEVRVYNYALAPVEVATLAALSTYYQLSNRTTGLFLDGMGRTGNGDNCGQFGSGTTSFNAFWALREVGSGYYQLQNRGTGLYLDGMGRTASGAVCGQFSSSGSPNQHWAVEQFEGDYYRIRNRASNLYLDGLGLSANGSNVSQWPNTSSTNAQWGFGSPATTARLAASLAAQLVAPESAASLYPSPVADVLHIRLPPDSRAAQVRVLDVAGRVLRKLSLNGSNSSLDVHDLPSGLYLVELTKATEITRLKFVKE
jgi:hypothetical protein